MMYIFPMYGRGACDVCSGIYPKGHKDQLARMISELSDRLNQKVVFFYGIVDEKTVFYLVLFTILLVQSVSAYEFIATIIKINDGDTLSAFVNNENTKIRLLDVDCYETKKNVRAKFQQKYYELSVDEVLEKGKQSRKILKKLLKDHRYIRVEWEKRDSFGRILGKVYLDDIKSNGIIDVNQYMLNQGGCNKYVSKSALNHKIK